jgi:hypothetical protein
MNVPLCWQRNRSHVLMHVRTAAAVRHSVQILCPPKLALLQFGVTSSFLSCLMLLRLWHACHTDSICLDHLAVPLLDGASIAAKLLQENKVCLVLRAAATALSEGSDGSMHSNELTFRRVILGLGAWQGSPAASSTYILHFRP